MMLTSRSLCEHSGVGEMQLLTIITFYGLLISLVAGGVAYFFRMGRLGMIQVAEAMKSMPAPPQLSDKDYKRIADVAEVPTSVADFFISLTPIGWLKSLGSCVVLVGRHSNLAFAGAMIGGLLGKLWYAASIPLIALDIVLHRGGY